MGTSWDKSRNFALSNDSTAGGKRAFEMPVGLKCLSGNINGMHT